MPPAAGAGRRLAYNKVGTEAIQAHPASSCMLLAGACDAQRVIAGWNGTDIAICARFWQIDLD